MTLYNATESDNRDQPCLWSHVITHYKQRPDRDQKLIEASPSSWVTWPFCKPENPGLSATKPRFGYAINACSIAAAPIRTPWASGTHRPYLEVALNNMYSADMDTQKPANSRLQVPLCVIANCDLWPSLSNLTYTESRCTSMPNISDRVRQTQSQTTDWFAVFGPQSGLQNSQRILLTQLEPGWPTISNMSNIFTGCLLQQCDYVRMEPSEQTRLWLLKKNEAFVCRASCPWKS